MTRSFSELTQDTLAKNLNVKQVAEASAVSQIVLGSP
jgi:hypothetical protein